MSVKVMKIVLVAVDLALKGLARKVVAVQLLVMALLLGAMFVLNLTLMMVVAVVD